MKKKTVKSMICTTFTLLAVAFCFQPADVSADMSNYNFVSIDSGAVDSITVNGVTVEALYRPYDSSVNTDSTYSCAAFVKRFYSQVYGRDVSSLLSTTSVPSIDSGSFYETSSPKVGDIIRDNQSVHWAIVKEVKGSTITVIQQNAWNGSYTQAWVGATIENGDPQYTFFSWNGNNSTNTSTGNYTINYLEPQVQETNAVVYAKVDNPDRVTVSQVGCYLWDSSDNLLKKQTEACIRPEGQFNMWYDIQAELGLTLTPGTTYKYQFFLIHNGEEYPGSVQTFTTAGSASSEPAADGAPVSTQESDAVISTYEEVLRTIGKLRELYGRSMDDMLEKLEPAYKVTDDKDVYYFPISTLMDRSASLILNQSGGGITRSEWRYVYSSGSDTAMEQSEALYDQFIDAIHSKIDAPAVDRTQDGDTMTSAYEDLMTVKRGMEDGRPYVSLSVVNDFDPLLFAYY